LHIGVPLFCGKVGWRATIVVLCAECVWHQLMEALECIDETLVCGMMCWRAAIVVLCAECVWHQLLSVSGTS
jgi:hypothetical protein